MHKLSTLLLTVVFTCSASAQWHQYLGPNADNTSNETGLLESWPKAGPPELWRIAVGPGFGGAAIDKGEVYILDREQSEADVLRVLDLKTGKEIWRYRYDAPGRVGYEGSRCTPSVTDTHVFTTGEFGHLYAFDRAKRAVAWTVALMEKYAGPDGGDELSWGYGMNPLLVDDLVVVACPSKSSPGLVAFKQATGEVAWESEVFGDANMYNSPHLRTIAGVTGICIRTVKNFYFIDPKTGATLFKHPCYTEGRIPIPPVTTMPGGDRVFVTQGYGMGSVMLSVTRDAKGEFSVEEIYRTIEGSQIHPPIVIGDHIYINHTENDTSKGAKRKFAGLACVDPKDGKVLWNTGEKPFIGRGGTLYVEGRLIMQDAEGGLVYLVEPKTEGFKPISSFKATDTKEKKAWAPLALGDGLLIVRDQDEMACFNLKK